MFYYAKHWFWAFKVHCGMKIKQVMKKIVFQAISTPFSPVTKVGRQHDFYGQKYVHFYAQKYAHILAHILHPGWYGDVSCTGHVSRRGSRGQDTRHQGTGSHTHNHQCCIDTHSGNIHLDVQKLNIH